MRAALALVLALVLPVSSASAAMIESPKSASGVASGIWLPGTRAHARQLADVHLERVCGYDGVASDIVNDPVNLRDPTGMVATCWPWESQDDCSAKVLSELKSNSDANDEYFRTHGRSRLRDTAKNVTLGLAAMVAAPFVAASTVESFVAAPVAFTAGVVGGELANQGAVALGVESPLVRFGLSLLGGMSASAVVRGIRASVLTQSSGALSTVDDLGRVSIAGPNAGGGGLIDPRTVRFSQDSIKASFRSGGTVDDLARSLRGSQGDEIAASISPIRLVELEGRIFTLDNRRLAAFSAAGRPVPYRMATEAEIAKEWTRKFTTTEQQGWGWYIGIRPGRSP